MIHQNGKWTKNPSELTTVDNMKVKLGNYYTSAKQISFVKSSNIVDSSTVASIDISKNQDGSIVANVASADTGLSGNLGYKITFKSEGIILAPTDCSSMFYNCKSLTSLDLSNFNTSNVTDMSYMFYSCNSLTSLDLSSFDTSNVTNMCWMFFGCDILASLDLSNFNTSNVTNMSYMFYYCNNLTSLDNNLIPSWYDS